MPREKAEKQKQKAKEMLGISDSRAKEIFEEQPDRKQQKRKELKEEGRLEDLENPESSTGEPGTGAGEETEAEEGSDDGEEEEVELHVCPECGDEFDSSRGMNVHKSKVH